MDPELREKKYAEFLDEATCWNGLENEILKLLILFNNCYASKTKTGEEMLPRQYVLEKVSRLMNKTPIVLDRHSTTLYVKLRTSNLLDEMEGKK